jgi:putative DNA primase/helicase
VNALPPPDAAPVTLALLAERPMWVAWQQEDREDGKPTKVPYAPDGRKAKANAPRTWGTRAAAEVQHLRLPKPYGLSGVGIEFCALGNGFSTGGIDLDTCRAADGTFTPWALQVIERFGTYAELSPSGTGAKLFFLYSTDDLPMLRTSMGGAAYGKQFKQGGGDHPPAVELHLGNRYFAVTDQHMEGTPAELRPVPLHTLFWLVEEAGPALVREGAKEPLFDQGTEAPEQDAEGDAGSSQDGADGSGDPTGLEARINAKAGLDKLLARRWRGDWSGLKEQSRSTKAFALMGALRRAGFGLDDAKSAVHLHRDTAAWAREKGDAAGGREFQRIWDALAEGEATREPILSASAPLDSARQLIARCHTTGGIRTLHHQNATFYTWAGSHYVETPPEEMRAALYRFLDGAKRLNDDGEMVAFDPTKSKVANVLEATAAEAQLGRGVRPPTWLDGADRPNPAEVIACANGLLHLPTRTLQGHTPNFFTLNALSFDYQPTPPEPEAWLAFLASLWPDDREAIATLQELFGLCLTGDTGFQKAFLIVGPKRSGKGTIARVLTELLGAANVCGPTLSSLGQNFGLAPLIGKRLAVVSDARLSGKADQHVIVERILAITGEDGLTIDRKFRDGWTGKLDVRFLILTNELPKLTDSSGALASRFIILTMTRSFFGKEDLALTSKLTAELPGILGWAIEGWKRLTARGYFVPPSSSADAQQGLEDLGSPIGAFLRDRCIVDPGLATRCDELYAAWCAWCREHGRDHPGTTQTFGRDLNAAVPGLSVSQPRAADGSRTRYYNGVTLDPDQGLARSGTRSDALRLLSPSYFADDPGFAA